MALAYLLSPTFEFVNTAGKPVTGGYLEVYISGTRDKYYCASDFDGTLHPFRIPLDSLGANVVLAEEGKAYDVYCYNRYGSLLMSRYGIKPGAGGGSSVDSITSTDGSIIVTETENGVDLSVNSEPPTSMRCSGEDLLVDGTFQFAELERDGLNASVYNHNVLLNKGWWHYDATVRLQWNGSSNATTPVQLYSAGSSDSMEFDLSYAHSETVQVSGEQKVNADGTQFVLGVTGIPTGMRVSLVDFGIHSITGEGAGGTYCAGTGIVINESDRLISVDTDTIQEKLTAGSNIVIEDNVISATAEPQQQADWAQSDSTAVDYIKNKPDMSEYATDAELTAGLSTKQDVISDLATIRSGAALGATAVQDSGYVHTDNNFTNADATKLSGIATGAEVNVQANWNETDTSSDAYILNKPTIPTVPTLKELVAGSNITITEGTTEVTIAAAVPSVPVTDVEVGGSSVVNAQGVAEVPAQVNADWNSSSGASEILNKPTLASVALSGDYDDLTNKPTIPAALSAGNGIDITSNVVSVDLDGSTLTNGVNGLSVTLPVPDTTGASQGDVLSVGPSGIAWTTPSSGSGGVFYATYNVTPFADILAAYTAGKAVYCINPTYTLIYSLTCAQSTVITFGASTVTDSNTVALNRYIQVMSNNVWNIADVTAVPVLNGAATQNMYLKSNGNYTMSWVSINQVPTSSSTDEGKVLTVNSSGNAEWTASTVPTIGTITI